MENLLRKRLEIIKARARAIRRGHPGGRFRNTYAPPCTLAEAGAGVERVVGTDSFYLFRSAGDELGDELPVLSRCLAEMAGRPRWPVTFAENLPFEGSDAIPPDQVCFFDIETCGLSPNTYVFLCGLLFLVDGRFVVEQAFARDYDEERGILLHLRDSLCRFRVLVTFNGDSFDVPFVRTRMAVLKIEATDAIRMVDLFGPARRAFAGRLPDCKLETIERHLSRRTRKDDIEGFEIPDAYHDFVRTGNASRIRQILYHNRMDLLAMVRLLNHLNDWPG